MVRKGILAIVTGMLLVSSAPAQTPWQFHWRAGQVLTYRVEHNTIASDAMGENKVEVKTTMKAVKRWTVRSVDAQGVATIELVLTALRLENTMPKGDVLLFDSADLEKSNPQMREQLSQHVGQPMAVLRVNASGQVLEVKESKQQNAANSYEAVPPFTVILPNAEPKANQYWERAYRITLDPPQGTGEKIDASQRCVCKSVGNGLATLALTTTVKKMPEAAAEQVPLLQSLPEGESVFDIQNGQLRSARLKIDQEVKGHQGEGSSYRFQMTYVEELVSSK